MLIVFGGLSGLESVVDSDEQLHVTKEDTSTLFDMYLNTCPAQGSRTIRTEEALLITMSLLRPYIQNNVVPKR
jgi:predicted SPOUT superfamily RNA methylase MTH1